MTMRRAGKRPEKNDPRSSRRIRRIKCWEAAGEQRHEEGMGMC